MLNFVCATLPPSLKMVWEHHGTFCYLAFMRLDDAHTNTTPTSRTRWTHRHTGITSTCNEHCLFGLVYACWRPPTMRILTRPKRLTHSYFGTAGPGAGSWLVEEASSPEFVGDNICSNELALLADTCWRVASTAASRRKRSSWYCISLWRSKCKRYSCSC